MKRRATRVRRRLYPHQIDALRYSRRRQHGAFFHQMRLGKTLTTIRRLLSYDPPGRILIVAPSSALGTWESELALEAQTDVCWLMGTRKQRLDLLSQKHKWNFINKEGHLALPEIANVPWKAVVIDESTFLKSPKTKVSKFFTRNFRRVPHRFILTGKPNPESPLDFFQQFLFLDGHMMGFRNFWQYRAVNYRPGEFRWHPKKQHREELRAYVAREAHVVRRRDVGYYEKRVYEPRLLTLPAPQRRVYKTVEREFVLEIEKKHGGRKLLAKTVYAMEKFIWLQHLCGGFIEGKLVWPGKIQELVSLLKGELSGESVVVWFNFNEEIAQTEAWLHKAGIDARSVTGEVPLKRRIQRQRAFNSGRFPVLLSQVALSEGYSLSGADTAIYYSSPTKSRFREQSEDRILRRDKGPLLYIDLLVDDSVDVDTYESVNRKAAQSNTLLEAFTERTKGA